MLEQMLSIVNGYTCPFYSVPYPGNVFGRSGALKDTPRKPHAFSIKFDRVPDYLYDFID